MATRWRGAWLAMRGCTEYGCLEAGRYQGLGPGSFSPIEKKTDRRSDPDFIASL